LKRRGILGLATGLLLALAACGGDDSNGGSSPDDRSPADVLVASASATRDAGTARVAIEQVTSAQGQDVTTTVEGNVDLVSGDSESIIKVEFPGYEPPFSPMRTKGLVAYIEATAFPGGARTDARWIKIDYAAMGAQMGINLEAFRQNGAGQLAYLSEVADVEEVRSDTVRGVDTTHYRFTTDLAELAESGPEELRSSFEQTIEITGSDEVPTQVWIDGDDRVRRLVTDLEMDLQGQQISQQTTIEYYEFGVEFDVQAPPEEDTVDITELGGGGGTP